MSKEFKKRLNVVINILGWAILERCHNCKKKFNVSILDEEAKCPYCGCEIISDSFLPEFCEIYQELFLEAIRGSWKVTVDGTGDYRYCFIQAYTSLECFLRQISQELMEKKKVDDKVISFILDEVRPDVKMYFSLFKKYLGISLGRKDEETTKKLIGVQSIRNKIVHKGVCSSEGEILNALETIAKVFYIFHEYSIFKTKRKIPPAEEL